MNDNKKQKLLKGYEKLAELGGFIKEEIEDELAEFYSKDVFEVAEKYCPVGPGFCKVADAVKKERREIYKYNFSLEDAETKEEIVFQAEREFLQWFYEQIARIETEKIRSGSKSFWNNWPISITVKNTLRKLNALEEQVFYLSKGFDGREPMNALQISQLPEFSCDEIYIKAILGYVERRVVKKLKTIDFNQICDEYATVQQ